MDEEEEREGGGAPPAKKAKRARTVVDYEAIVRDDARHVRGVWAETTAQLSQAKGGSASVRVEVEKSLAAFLPRLVRHLRERDVDPAVDARAAQDRRQRELADEEARLAADVLELERQLEDLTSVNLGQRDDLRALAVPSPCDLQQQDQALLLLLSSLPPRASSQVSSPLLPLENALFKPPDGLWLIRQSHQGDGEEQEEGTSLGGLRNDVDAAFARFIESATKLDEETAGTERGA